MMAIAAIYRGHKVITLDPAANCPAARVSEVIVALWWCGGSSSIGWALWCPDLWIWKCGCRQLRCGSWFGRSAARNEVVTYLSKPVTREVKFLSSTDSGFSSIASFAHLQTWEIMISLSSVLKTATGGYDGHGQVVIRERESLPTARVGSDTTLYSK